DAHAQTVLREYQGTLSAEHLGRALAGGRDADGDGYDDVVAGSSGRNLQGRVDLYSGRSGALLWRHEGLFDGEDLGAAVAFCGDLDGDGAPDIVAGSPHLLVAGSTDTGEVTALSGATASVIWSVPRAVAGDLFGTAVADMGGVDGDGIDDVAAAAPKHSNPKAIHGGKIYVLSGPTGALIRSIELFDGQASLLGQGGLAPTGDVDHDHVPD